MKRSSLGIRGSKVYPARPGHTGEPLLQHHIVAQSFEQGLKQMGMGIHMPGITIRPLQSMTSAPG